MRNRQKAAFEVFDNPILVGTVTILIVIVAVYLSYIAENGLPFVPTYNIKVDVANAAELVKNADVRIGGARVGQVLTISPELPTKQWPHPYAQLGLALEKSLEPLPMNSRYQVRLASVLGGKYVEIVPGTTKGAGLPDGGELTLSTKANQNHNIPFVDLDTAFKTFGPKTRQGLRSATSQLGEALAGRGTDFNDATYSGARLIGPLENLLRLFAARSTHLPQFVSGLAATTGALAPVAPTFSSLLADGAITFAALQKSALGQTLDQLAPTETLGTTVLTNSLPVLANAAAIVQALKPGAALLPRAAQGLDKILLAAPRVFRALPPVGSGLKSALSAVDKLAKDPASTQAFKVLGANDLGTSAASGFVGLGAILNAVAPAQFSCNVAGVWVRNFASALSEGDNVAGWLRFMPIIDIPQMLQASQPSSDLNYNYYPKENSSQCQAGNEVYSGSLRIGDPGRTTTVVDTTTPPAGVLALGKKAGLVPAG